MKRERKHSSSPAVYVRFRAVALALALCAGGAVFARPVGEWEEPSETSTPSQQADAELATLSNFTQIEKTLQQAGTWQTIFLTPESAAKKSETEAENYGPWQLEEAAATKTLDTPSSISTGEVTPEADVSGSVSGTGVSYDDSMPAFLPFDTRKLESSVAGMRQVPGVSLPNPLINSYRPMPGTGGDRAPAVLPVGDPSLKGLFMPAVQMAQAQMSDMDLAKKRQGQENQQGIDPAGFKKKGEKKNEEGDKDQAKREQIQKVVNDLLGRPTPYSQKDYEDFRDFIAKQRKELGEMDDFREKAKQAYDLWQDDDKDPYKARNKEEFFQFINDMEEAQPLFERRLPGPTRDTHGGGFQFGGRPQAN